jgi:peptide/nickel transport system ATP-binding protein
MALRGDTVVPDTVPAVISVDGLTAWHGRREVLRDVSIKLRERECLAVVGQSGSGKTTLARCIIGLHRGGQRGALLFRDKHVAERSRDRPKSVRQEMQYIFQSPYGALNGRQTCGDIVALPIRFFDKVGRREARRRTEEAMVRVGLTSRAANRYPDELSGGERQRVAIARALVCRPEVLICDEVTSALDVSVQATILHLLSRLQAEDGLSMIFITHNLAIVRNIADRVVVMHEGAIVESGVMTSVLDEPRESYTKQLLADTPVMPASAAA